MAIFNSYVKLPEGTHPRKGWHIQFSVVKFRSFPVDSFGTTHFQCYVGYAVYVDAINIAQMLYVSNIDQCLA